MEGTTATLHCELSKEAPVEWRKGPETLRAGDRVSLRQDGVMCELEIRGLMVADAGEYSCVCGQERTSATLTVQGKDCVQPHGPIAWCMHFVSMSSPSPIRLCRSLWSLLLSFPEHLLASISSFRICHDIHIQSVSVPLGHLLPSFSVHSYLFISQSFVVCVVLVDVPMLDTEFPTQSYVLCVTLTLLSPALQVHKGSEDGRGHGRCYGHTAL